MAIPELENGTSLRPETDGATRYQVTSLLGVGGFGITYRARDRRLSGNVVIKEFACDGTSYRDTVTGNLKVVSGQAALHERFFNRFLSEARLLNRMRSPNVVRVIDVWTERGTAYYAMDEVPGAAQIRRWCGGGMEWDHVEKLASQMLDALKAVHDAGLVHGDIKPENVLVDRDGNVVLIDFGTALTDADLSKTASTIAFTSGYAAPELMHHARVRESGPWSDLYGWAMITWALVKAHDGPEMRPVDAMLRTRKDPYVDAVAYLTDLGVPPGWAMALHASIHLEPDDRPRDVDMIRSIIDGAKPAQPVVASTSITQRANASGSKDTPGRSRISPWIIAAAGVTVGATIAITFALMQGNGSSADNETSPVNTVVASGSEPDPGTGAGPAATGAEPTDGVPLSPETFDALPQYVAVHSWKGYERLRDEPDYETARRIKTLPNGTKLIVLYEACGTDSGRWAYVRVPANNHPDMDADAAEMEGWFPMQAIYPYRPGCCRGREYDCGHRLPEEGEPEAYFDVDFHLSIAVVNDGRESVRSEPVYRTDLENRIVRMEFGNEVDILREVCTPTGLRWAEVTATYESDAGPVPVQGWMQRNRLTPNPDGCCLGRGAVDEECSDQ